MIRKLSTWLFLLPQGLLSYPAAQPSQSATPWPAQYYKTEPFNTPVLKVSQSGKTAPGYLFFAPSGPDATDTAPLITTNTGELIWQPETFPNGSAPLNFKISTIHNVPYLSYWEGVSIATYGHGYGGIRILDSSYQQKYFICPKLNIVTPDNSTYPCELDMHESYITNKGTVVATAYNITQADLTSVGGRKDGWIFDGLFFEFDIATGRQLFSWRASDHLDQFPFKDSFQPVTFDNTTTGLNQSVPWDFFHINSVQALDDGYLVNSRHFFTFAKVNKKGHVEWRAQGATGRDFTLGPGVNYSWQHNPRTESNPNGKNIRVHLFDNANSQVNPVALPTRGLLLDVDIKNRHISLVKSFQDPTDVVVARSQGSYQPLTNGNVLLGYGQVAKIREFDAKSGATIFTANFGPTANTSLDASYRAYRYEWKGQPKTAPKVVATASKGQTTVYMSWNGATEYTKWEILTTGAGSASGKPIKVAKDGFETSHVIKGTPKSVQVKALAKGKVLGTSKVVKVHHA